MYGIFEAINIASGIVFCAMIVVSIFLERMSLKRLHAIQSVAAMAWLALLSTIGMAIADSAGAHIFGLIVWPFNTVMWTFVAVTETKERANQSAVRQHQFEILQKRGRNKQLILL